jgi:hypothetical protein
VNLLHKRGIGEKQSAGSKNTMQFVGNYVWFKDVFKHCLDPDSVKALIFER